MLRGADGNPVRDGSVGELLVRGPKTMAGYLDDEAASRAALVDGWLATGDLMARDADGYHWFMGRRKNLIVLTSGDNVSPVEVEKVMLTHPDVAACAVVGVPTPNGGEAPAALVVRRDNRVTSRRLAAFLGQRLSDFKIPRRIRFVERLPTGMTGKIDREKSRCLLAAGGPSSVGAAGPLGLAG